MCALLDDQKKRRRLASVDSTSAAHADLLSSEALSDNPSASLYNEEEGCSLQAEVAIGAQPFMQESEQPNENMDAEQPSALQSMPIRAKAAIPLLGSAVQENPSFCGADLPLEDLLKIATPDYRSSEESSLSPDRLLYRLDDLLRSMYRHHQQSSGGTVLSSSVLLRVYLVMA